MTALEVKVQPKKDGGGPDERKADGLDGFSGAQRGGHVKFLSPDPLEILPGPE